MLRPTGDLIAMPRTFANILDQMGETPSGLQKIAVPDGRIAEAIGGGGGGFGSNDDDDLQARLDSLRK